MYKLNIITFDELLLLVLADKAELSYFSVGDAGRLL